MFSQITPLDAFFAPLRPELSTQGVLQDDLAHLIARLLDLMFQAKGSLNTEYESHHIKVTCWYDFSDEHIKGGGEVLVDNEIVGSWGLVIPRCIGQDRYQ